MAAAATESTDTCSTGTILVVVSAVVLIIAICMLVRCIYGDVRGGAAASEAFAPCTREWGYSQHEDDAMRSRSLPTAASAVSGPDPNSTQLHTWQYHPQNSLVDYRFYRPSHCLDDRAKSRIAPIVDGRLGKQGPAPANNTQLRYTF